MTTSTPGVPNAKVTDIGAIVLAVVGVSAGLSLALLAAAAPQCCDADGYRAEGRALLASGWRGGWLPDKHNYLYGAFHAAMLGAGAVDRVPFAIAQSALLYASVVFLAVAIARVFQRRLAPILAGLSLVALLPAAAWSGYWLTEAIATPIILALIASWLVFAMRPGPPFAFAVGMLSAMAWMSRPALVWLPPLVAVGMVMALRKEPSLRNRLLSAALFAIAIGAVVLPQWLITPNLDQLLHLSLARLQTGMAPVIFRYATNLSGCGEPAMVFSPLTSELSRVADGSIQAPHSIAWSFRAGAAHLVSGWDARPSPTYMTAVSNWPWLAVTLLSGFVMLAPLKLASSERRRETAPAALGLLALFLLSQAALVTTATEFRFNMIGWMVGGVSLVILGRSIDRRYLAYAATLTLLIALSGQFTLHYSPAWNTCAR